MDTYLLLSGETLIIKFKLPTEFSWMVTAFSEIIQMLSIQNYEKSHNDCSLTEKYTGKCTSVKASFFCSM